MNFCDLFVHGGRIGVFLLGGAGLACSIVVALSCEFFKFDASNEAEFLEPFENMNQAYVGIFSYTLESGGKCVDYNENFLDSQFGEMFQAAQVSAVAAPAMALLALLVTLADMLFCSSMCSFLLSCLLFLGACAIQGCTFLVYGQNEFCFDEGVSDYCSLGIGSILSIVATVCFYVCSILLCCMPRPNPCLGKPIKRKHEDDKEFDTQLEATDTVDPNKPPEDWEPDEY